MPTSETAPPTSTIPKPLLSCAQDVARMLDVSERSVWRMSAAGKMPRPVSVGGKSKRWRTDEVAAWVAAGCPDRAAWESARKK